MSKQEMNMSKRTGGPRTKSGKAVSAMNAMRHGVMCLSVPAPEREAYAGHVAGVLASLAPVGFLEERLAERVALTLWRLRRLDVWEASMLERQRDLATRKAVVRDIFQSPAPHGFPIHLMDAGEVLKALDALSLDSELTRPDDPARLRRFADEEITTGRALIALEDLKPAAVSGAIKRLDEHTLHELAYALTDELEKRGVTAAAILGAVGDDESEEVLDHAPWEPGEVVNLWRLMATTDEQAPQWPGGPGGVARRKGYDILFKGERLAELAARAEVLLSQGAGLALLPPDADQAKLQRYDAHLERTLYRALHELEAMQERRKGGATPLARVEVHGADERAG